MTRRDRAGLWSTGLAFVVWIAAVAPSLWYVRHAPGPYDWDGFRDVAMAQAVADGAWGQDPLYEGEAAWYPPLVPATVALTAQVTATPMPRAYVLTGLWLNALIPALYFLCARRLIGDWAALVAMCAFVFLPGRAPAWASGTYSPWPFPAVTAQISFFAALWFWMGTIDSNRVWRFALAGVWLGATFWAHSAPAVVLAGIMAGMTVTASSRPDAPTLARRMASLGVAFAVAIVVVAPFIVPLIAHYRLQTVNREPAMWAYEAAQPAALFKGFARPSSVVNALMILAGAVWALRALARQSAQALASWVLAATGGLLYCLAAERSNILTPLVPAYHFLFSLRSVSWLLLGYGAMSLYSPVVAWLRSRRGLRVSEHHARAVLVLLIVCAIYPRYLGREAFHAAVVTARDVLTDDERSTYAWLREHTDRRAVVLSSDLDALLLVGPAGRHVVSVAMYFSNPYVSHEERARDRNTMLGAVLGGDRDALERVRPQYGITHVLVREQEAAAIRTHSSGMLRQVHRQGDITIFEVEAR